VYRPSIYQPSFCAQHKNIYGLASVLELWKLFGFEIYFPKVRGIEIMAKD
jgi:hypothetical protein